MILNEYIALVLSSSSTGADIFPASMGLLQRPSFFERYLRPWILEGMEERRRSMAPAIPKGV